MKQPVGVLPAPVGPSGDTGYPKPRYAWYVPGVLTLVYVFSFLDRQILNLLVAPIRRDTQMSLMIGFTFALFYVAFGIPLGRLADSGSRTRLITAGYFIRHFHWAAGIGPTAVALFTDYVFKDDNVVGYSLLIVTCVAHAIAAACLWCGRKPYVRTLQAAEDWMEAYAA